MIHATLDEINNNLKNGQRIKYKHEGSLMVYLDISLLKHIVLNLISNASKFSPQNAEIEVKTKCKNNVVILCVKDAGIGISKEDQHHLMERFFRAPMWEMFREPPWLAYYFQICRDDARKNRI